MSTVKDVPMATPLFENQTWKFISLIEPLENLLNWQIFLMNQGKTSRHFMKDVYLDITLENPLSHYVFNISITCFVNPSFSELL